MRRPRPRRWVSAGCCWPAWRCTGLAGAWALQELLITLFLFVTAPVSANLLAKAALHLRVPSKAPVPPDQPQP